MADAAAQGTVVTAEGQLTLAVDGRRYGGWTSASLERSLDMFSDPFRLQYTDRWAEHKETWPIREGAAAQLFFGSELLTTGYVNTAEWKVTGEDWSLSANGRSKPGDLEDCSAVHDPGIWKNVSPLKIAQELCEPHGISVKSTAAPALQPTKRFALQEGETVHDALERLAEQVALLPMSLPDGGVELMRADIPRDKVLILPVDSAIERCIQTNDQERFSHYYVVAQGRGDRNRAGKAVVSAKYLVQDETVKRHRPLVVMAEHGEAQLASLVARATWERNVRAGRAMRYKCVLLGVLAPDKKTWRPGTHCVVKDLQLGVDETLVLVRAEIRASASELATELEFTRPQGYSILDYPPKELNPKPRISPPEVNQCVDLTEEEYALIQQRRGNSG